MYHGDIKPDNILFRDKNILIFADYSEYKISDELNEEIDNRKGILTYICPKKM
jgi:hypothetical protein